MNDEDFRAFTQDKLVPFAIAMRPDFQTPFHVEQIARKLQQLEQRKIRRLMIFMPPRHGKSLLANELFPAWYMGRNPGQNVISTTYSDEVANGFGRKVRNLIASDQFQQVFPKCDIVDDSAAANRFITTQGGEYYAVGAGGALTSRGADLIIIDDIHKNRAESKSEAISTRLREWFGPVLYTRLHPNGVVVLIQTRWVESDLPGWLLETQGKDWDVLSLPAISDDGKALWPDRYPVETLEEIKRTIGLHDFTALYQQRPSPEEGDIVKREWWRYYDELPEQFDAMAQSWDLTFKDGEKNDFTVGTVWGRKGADKYLVDMVRARMGFNAQLESFKSLTAAYPRASAKYVEEAANGAALIDSLRKQIPGIIPIRPRTSKLNRAEAVSPQIRSGNVYLPNPSKKKWSEEVIEEWASFPNGAHDDIVDSMSQGIIEISNAIPTQIAPISVKGVSKWLR